MDGKAYLKGAWLSHVNHLNFGGHNHIPGTALSTQFAGECHKLLTVGDNVDHIHRRDLYSAAGPSRRNGFTAQRSYASAVLGVVILSVCPSVTRVLWRRLSVLELWVPTSCIGYHWQYVCSHCVCAVSRDICREDKLFPHIWNPWSRFPCPLYNVYGSTIKSNSIIICQNSMALS